MQYPVTPRALMHTGFVDINVDEFMMEIDHLMQHRAEELYTDAPDFVRKAFSGKYRLKALFVVFEDDFGVLYTPCNTKRNEYD